ncbi:hypothetical protein HK097_002853, partial [Rhizophlyctis rosea]
ELLKFLNLQKDENPLITETISGSAPLSQAHLASKQQPIKEESRSGSAKPGHRSDGGNADRPSASSPSNEASEAAFRLLPAFSSNPFEEGEIIFSCSSCADYGNDHDQSATENGDMDEVNVWREKGKKLAERIAEIEREHLVERRLFTRMVKIERDEIETERKSEKYRTYCDHSTPPPYRHRQSFGRGQDFHGKNGRDAEPLDRSFGKAVLHVKSFNNDHHNPSFNHSSTSKPAFSETNNTPSTPSYIYSHYDTIPALTFEEYEDFKLRFGLSTHGYSSFVDDLDSGVDEEYVPRAWEGEDDYSRWRTPETRIWSLPACHQATEMMRRLSMMGGVDLGERVPGIWRNLITTFAGCGKRTLRGVESLPEEITREAMQLDAESRKIQIRNEEESVCFHALLRSLEPTLDHQPKNRETTTQNLESIAVVFKKGDADIDEQIGAVQPPLTPTLQTKRPRSTGSSSNILLTSDEEESSHKKNGKG